MSRYYVAALLLFLLVIEGTIVPNAVANFLQIDAIMVPRFLVVVIVFIGIYIGRSQSLIHGLIFGFVYDVVYTEFLGIYMFGFAFIGLCTRCVRSLDSYFEVAANYCYRSLDVSFSVVGMLNCLCATVMGEQAFFDSNHSRSTAFSATSCPFFPSFIYSGFLRCLGEYELRCIGMP